VAPEPAVHGEPEAAPAPDVVELITDVVDVAGDVAKQITGGQQ
jgi:hypothetical protein